MSALTLVNNEMIKGILVEEVNGRKVINLGARDGLRWMMDLGVNAFQPAIEDERIMEASAVHIDTRRCALVKRKDGDLTHVIRIVTWVKGAQAVQNGEVIGMGGVDALAIGMFQVGDYRAQDIILRMEDNANVEIHLTDGRIALFSPNTGIEFELDDTAEMEAQEPATGT